MGGGALRPGVRLAQNSELRPAAELCYAFPTGEGGQVRERFKLVIRIERAIIGLVTVLLSAVAGTGPVSAITAEVARACETAAAKEFPPRQIGNPAAGSSKGTPKERLNYFNKCVANNGKVDNGPAETAPNNASK